MTYGEYFRHRQAMHKTHAGRQLTDQELDEEIALIDQLPCTGRGPRKPVFSADSADHVAIGVRRLDSGVGLPAEYGCMHCTMLAAYNFIKAAIEAEKNRTPLPPMP